MTGFYDNLTEVEEKLRRLTDFALEDWVKLVPSNKMKREIDLGD